ncbi:MAG: hypothetical protein GY758_35010 [Fuerstiella sp.]|nr:hypothetical protein [Fuerstiella sp.]MCP4508716.1 hypothetical protein [Fuerstiella sp.]
MGFIENRNNRRTTRNRTAEFRSACCLWQSLPAS